MKRPSWDEYFILLAGLISNRSPCKKRHVGAIIIKDNHILSTGYNGPPSGYKHCEVCTRKSGGVCMAIHAEQNAIIQAAKHGVSINNSTLYTTLSPCLDCAKIIINSGIVKVVYFEEYTDNMALEVLQTAGVRVVKYDKVFRY